MLKPLITELSSEEKLLAQIKKAFQLDSRAIDQLRQVLAELKLKDQPIKKHSGSVRSRWAGL